MYKKRWYVLGGAALLLTMAAVSMHSSWLARMAVRHVLEKQPGVVVKGVHIGRQSISLPGRLELDAVRIGLEIKSKSFLLQAPRITVTGLHSYFSRDRHILVSARNMLVRYDVGEINEAGAEFTVSRDGMIGPVTAEALRWDRWRGWDAAGFLVVNQAGVELRAVKLSAYGGTLTGKVLVPDRKAGVYAAEMFIEGVDVARLTAVNAGLAAQLNGPVTGSVRFDADAGALRSLETDLTMPSGGRVSASLLAALTQYLPQSREKKRLDALIRRGGKLAMEVFAFTMKGGLEGHYSGEIHLRSREVNLEINLTHEISTDGTAASLLSYWQRYIN